MSSQAISSSIPLRSGWNLVAAPVTPSDSTPAAAFASIAGKFSLVYAYDACDAADPWKKYDPAAPPLVNDLSAVNPARGMWINATADTTWIVTGTIPTSISIVLCPGQNLIGYPTAAAVALPDALAGISGKYTNVRAYDAADAADPWKIFDPTVPSFINDLTELGPAKGYWIDMQGSASLTVGSAAAATPRVNAPYFDGAVDYSELAIFWFGKVTSTDNYADVRVGYDRNRLVLNVAAFDRRLWYDPSPSLADLTSWDAVTMYISTDGGSGSTLGTSAYRFDGQLTWWEDPRTQWQAAYRYDGTAWVLSALPFTTYAG